MRRTGRCRSPSSRAPLVAGLVALKNGHTTAPDPGCGHRRRHLGDGRDLHPARRRRADRHLEHGRHHPDRRLLRHRAAAPSIFYPAVALICAVVGLVTGSSWTTAGTLGRRLRRHGADPRHVDPAIAAGAVISGAYLGDKMSPLSETTVLVPSLVGGVTTSASTSAACCGRSGRPFVHRPRRLPRARAPDAGVVGLRSVDQARDALAAEFNDLAAQPAAARAPDRPLAPPGRRRSSRSSPSRCSPASWPSSPSRTRSRRSSTTRPKARCWTASRQSTGHWRPASCRSTGNATIDALFSRGGMASMLTHGLADPGRAVLRRDHGGRRVPRPPDPPRSSTAPSRRRRLIASVPAPASA